MASGPSKLLGWGPAATAIGGAGVVLTTTLYFVSQSQWSGPSADLWFRMPHVQRFFAGEDFLWQLFTEGGGHRMFFPNALFIAEFALFRGTNTFLNSCGLVLQTITAGLLIRCVWREPQLSRKAAIFLTGLTGMLLFSATQITNFVRPLNVCYFLAFAPLTWSVLALVRARDAYEFEASGEKNEGRAARVWLAASLAAVTVASYSMFNGILGWPALILLSAGLRLPRRWIGFMTLAAVAIVGPYFLGYAPSAAGDWPQLLASPGAYFTWVARTLGGPLTWTHPLAGTLLGFAGILAGCLVLLNFVARRSPRLPVGTLQAVYIGVLSFTLASAFVAGLGRMGQWEESWRLARYQTFVLLFWLSLIGLATLRFERRAGTSGESGEWHRSGRTRWALGAGGIAWLLLILMPSHFRQAEKQLEVSARIREANDAIRTGIDDPRIFRPLLPRVGVYLRGASPVFHYSPFLRAHELGAFASEKNQLLDVWIGADLSIDPIARCRGEVTRHDVLGEDNEIREIRLAGWAWDEARGAAPRWILISNESGKTIGLGSRTKRWVNVLEREWSRAAVAEWAAYARSAPGEQLTVWGVTERGTVCRVARLGREEPVANVLLDGAAARSTEALEGRPQFASTLIRRDRTHRQHLVSRKREIQAELGRGGQLTVAAKQTSPLG